MKRKIIALLCAGLLALALFVSAALAENGYTLTWWTVDGGGATSPPQSGYSLSGTIGQPEAGVLANSGYSLSGGFWHAASPPANPMIFLPLVNK